MYRFAQRRSRAGLGAAPQGPVAIGKLRTVVQTGLKALAQYDIFLRDRTAIEWLKDNTWFQYARDAAARATHEEAPEFWGRLNDWEKRNLVESWMKLSKRGGVFLDDNKNGGIGAGFGPGEPAPPQRARAVLDWGSDVQSFLQQIEDLRSKKRVEARTDPHTGIFGEVKNFAVGAAVVVGVLVLGLAAIRSSRS